MRRTAPDKERRTCPQAAGYGPDGPCLIANASASAPAPWDRGPAGRFRGSAPLAAATRNRSGPHPATSPRSADATASADGRRQGGLRTARLPTGTSRAACSSATGDSPSAMRVASGAASVRRSARNNANCANSRHLACHGSPPAAMATPSSTRNGASRATGPWSAGSWISNSAKGHAAMRARVAASVATSLDRTVSLQAKRGSMDSSGARASSRYCRFRSARSRRMVGVRTPPWAAVFRSYPDEITGW